VRSIFVRFLDVEVEQSIVELSADEEFEREVVGSFDFLLSVVQLCVVPVLEETVSSAQSNSLEDSCLVDVPWLTSEGRSQNTDDAIIQASQGQFDIVHKDTSSSVSRNARSNSSKTHFEAIVSASLSKRLSFLAKASFHVFASPG